MATRVELPKKLVQDALELSAKSKQRAINGATNEIIKGALEEELKHLTIGKNTLQEIK